MSTEPVQITNETIRQLSAIRLDELNDCRKLAKMPLREAGNEWLETRKPFLDPHTVLDYGLYIGTHRHTKCPHLGTGGSNQRTGEPLIVFFFLDGPAW